MNRRLIAFSCGFGLLLLTNTPQEAPVSFDRVVEMDPGVFSLVEDLLRTGTTEVSGWTLDFDPLGTIERKDNALIFDPPIKVSGKAVGLPISTTISMVQARSGHNIYVEIDNSPIDILLRPETQ